MAVQSDNIRPSQPLKLWKGRTEYLQFMLSIHMFET